MGGVPRICDHLQGCHRAFHSQNHRIDLAPLPHCPSQILLRPPLKCFFSPPLSTAITALVPCSLSPECLQSSTCPWSLRPPSSPYNNSLNPHNHALKYTEQPPFYREVSNLSLILKAIQHLSSDLSALTSVSTLPCMAFSDSVQHLLFF